MKPEIKKLWVDALRSGKYEKGTGSLCKIIEDGTKLYCCLGVLTDLYDQLQPESEWSTWDDGGVGSAAYANRDGDDLAVEEEMAVLPYQVMHWAGLSSPNPKVEGRSFVRSLTHLNDAQGLPFTEIADAIERSL